MDAVGFDDDDKLFFELDLGSFTDYDSVRVSGDSLEVNVTLMFNGFDSGAPGFLEYPHGSTTPSATFNGFSDEQPTGAIFTANPLRQLMVVEYDSTYSSGNRFVVSDGHRTHTWVVFADVSTVLPEQAFVTRADFVLTQADSTVGLSFGVGPLHWCNDPQ